MTFEEALAKIQKGYAKVDASAVTEHVAVQLNIQGEGEGALYVEVADGKVNVAGYEYYDKDATLYATADEFVKLATFKVDLAKEIAEDRISVSGTYEKALELAKIVKKAPAKKTTKKAAAEAVVEAAVAEEAAPVKKTRKPCAKKAAKTEAVAEAAVAEEAPVKKTRAKRTTKKAADAE